MSNEQHLTAADSEPQESPALDDPVRVVHESSGWRVYWYPSGTPGVGKRLRKRQPSEDAAEAFADERRIEIMAGTATERSLATLDQMSEAWVIWMRATHVPKGTLNQHRTRLNNWILPFVGAVMLGSLEYRHWKRCIDTAAEAGKAPNTVSGVSSTLLALVEWGRESADDWLADDHFPFGDNERRAKALDTAKETAARVRAANEKVAARAAVDAAAEAGEEPPSRVRPRKRPAVDVKDDEGVVPFEVVPDWDDYCVIADAVADEFTGDNAERARRWVRVVGGTGVRFAEGLAFKTDNLDRDEGKVSVLSQLDRYEPWPAIADPKNGSRRDAHIWTFVVEDWDWLAERAHADGWLLAPTRGQAWWLASMGKAVERAVAKSGWSWPGLHWGRHMYASYNLHGADVGGYDRKLADVSSWLGHKKPSTTSDIYLHASPHAARAAMAVTIRPPGLWTP